MLLLEVINIPVQLVQVNRDVLFANTVVCGNNSLVHRTGSGLITARGLCRCQCRARFKATFSGNIAIPTTGALGPISLSIALDGEPMDSTTMIVTPTALGSYFNVASTIYFEVPCGCCSKVSVRNTSVQAINVQNANLIVERVA